MSGPGCPDPAFVSALAVFSKGRAFAFEARKWSRQGPSREALAWLLAPLASLWLAFGGQFGRKDGIKNQRKFETKFQTKSIENSSPGPRKSGPFLNRKNRGPGFVFGTVAPSRPRASPGVPKAVPGLPLGAPWAPIGRPWDSLGHILSPLSAPLATLRVPLASLTPPFVTLALPQGDERKRHMTLRTRMGFPSRPILRRGVNPPKIQKVGWPSPPFCPTTWPEKALAFRASPA